jgi:hypothetical protein
LGIENRKLNIFFLSFPTGNNYPKKIKINFNFNFILFFERLRCVRTSPHGLEGGQGGGKE